MIDKTARDRVSDAFSLKHRWPTLPHYLESVRSEIADLRQRNSWRPILQILFDWFSVLGIAKLSHEHFDWATYFLAVIFIATRQHSMLMLGHEGAHYFLSKNRKINDCLAEIILSWPFFITMHGFRREHIAHHKLAASGDDPEMIMMSRYKDYQYPKSRIELTVSHMKHLAGFITIRHYFNLLIVGQYGINTPKILNFYRLIYYAALSIAATWLDVCVIVFSYWIVPALTVLVFLLYFRLSAEHFALEEDTFFRTRTVIPTWWEKLVFCPVNINYHLAHHLFPMVPYYHLKELHERLMKIPQFRDDAHIVNGYTNGFMKECLGASAP